MCIRDRCERDDMKNSYLSWQQEIKLVKIQKKKEVDKAREEYEAKLQSAIEEATKLSLIHILFIQV